MLSCEIFRLVDKIGGLVEMTKKPQNDHFLGIIVGITVVLMVVPMFSTNIAYKNTVNC